MAFNWSSIGSTLKSALSTVGGTITSGNLGAVISQLDLSANPDKTEEMALCAQIIACSTSPTLVSALEQKLVTEDGLPPSAAVVASQLGQPGVDTVAKALQIEQIINQGG